MHQLNRRRIFISKWRNVKRGMEQHQKKKKRGHLCERKEGREHWNERCRDLGGELKCMRCGKRSKQDDTVVVCHDFKWMGEYINNTVEHRATGTMVDMTCSVLRIRNGRILVWRRKWSGDTTGKLVRKLLHS